MLNRSRGNVESLQSCLVARRIMAWQSILKLGKSGEQSCHGGAQALARGTAWIIIFDQEESPMSGWFAPKCPLDTWEKTWTETRMRWLADQFGIEQLLQTEVILPTDQYFPDPYHGTAADARQLMNQLCGYMGIDPQRIDLEVCADFQLPGAAGHYDA